MDLGTQVVVITLSGELDLATVPTARQHLIERTPQYNPYLVIDLGQVTFCDSSGVGMLVGQAKRVRNRRGAMVFACATDRVSQLLNIRGLSQLFDLYTTVAEAKQALAATTAPSA